jgi:hypothetical protein
LIMRGSSNMGSYGFWKRDTCGSIFPPIRPPPSLSEGVSQRHYQRDDRHHCQITTARTSLGRGADLQHAESNKDKCPNECYSDMHFQSPFSANGKCTGGPLLDANSGFTAASSVTTERDASLGPTGAVRTTTVCAGDWLGNE